MSAELNFAYFNFLNAKIVCAEAIVAVIGAILNSTSNSYSHPIRASGFLSFVFWTTVILSVVIVVINVLNIYPKLIGKYGVIVGQCELVYVGLWVIFYAICALFSLIAGSNEKNLGVWNNETSKREFSYWSSSTTVVHVCCFIEIILFLVDGYLQYKIPRIVSSTTTKKPEEQGKTTEQQGISWSTLEKQEKEREKQETA